MTEGSYAPTKHIKARMAEYELQEPDILNVLRGGWAEESKTAFEFGTWRYQSTLGNWWSTRPVRSQRVVAFRGLDRLVGVTCWRKMP